MSYVRRWAVWRRIQYGFGFFSMWGLVFTGIYFSYYYQPANCFDLKANGDEVGLDCGGACVRICASQVIPPQLVWAKSFEIVEGQYNAVAYVENKNKTAATPKLEYTFQLFNNGEVIAERSGFTILPPDSVYPLFEGRVFTDDDQFVTDTLLTLKPVEMWMPATIGRDQFQSSEELLTGSDDKPRLSVKIENTELKAAENVEVVATIFSENGQAVTASQSFMERIEGRSTQDLFFTWPNSIAKTVRNCVIPTDVVLGIDLSGSMNNDSDSPPQPVTDALAAASEFVETLRDNDRVSVVTYATKADLTSKLTLLHGGVAEAVKNLKIAPAEEVGYTNTADALETAQLELGSERHNQDARRVLILLTDGLPTAKGDFDAVGAAVGSAKVVHNDGIEVYAIGLGQNVDSQFINKIASSPTNAYLAPTSKDLKRIYTEITSSLCEVGPTKIDVFAKTKTNFTPLK